MIIGCGSWSDNSPTDYGIFLVLRKLGAKSYLMAPFGTKDPEWSKWFSDKQYVKVVLWRKESDPVPEDEELLRHWRIISEKGEVPHKDDYEEFGKKIVDGIQKKWEILNELVVSEKPPPKAATDPHFSVSVKGAGH